LASNFNTSSTTAVDTPLSVAIAANEKLDIIIVGTVSKATTTTGVRVGISAPAGATIAGFQQSGAASLNTAMTNSLLTAINTLGTTFATGAGVEVPFRMEFAVDNSSTAGNITLQIATVTSNAVTLFAKKSKIMAFKTTEV
jgi:hypothetical protein